MKKNKQIEELEGIVQQLVKSTSGIMLYYSTIEDWDDISPNIEQILSTSRLILREVRYLNQNIRNVEKD